MVRRSANVPGLPRTFLAAAALMALLVVSFALPQRAAAAPENVDASATQLNWVATSPAGATVTLNGSNSSSDVVLFHWYTDCPDENSCTGEWLNEFGAQDQPTFAALLPIGSHQITLWGATTAGNDLTPSPTITVVVSDVEPVANAGADQTVSATAATGAEVTLSGAGSTAAASFSWTIEDTVIGATESTTHEFPLGITTVTLTVTSVTGATDSDDVIVTVLPVADAGDNIAIDATTPSGGYVTLDGTASIGEVVAWRVAGATIGTAPLIEGIFFPIFITTVELVVAGPGDLEVSDFIQVTVRPVANAGSDLIVPRQDSFGAEVGLGGQGSFFADNSTFVWTDEFGTQLATGIFNFIFFPVGVHEVTLTLTGPDGQTSTDSVVVEVTTPLANANATQQQLTATSEEGALVTLDGSLSISGADSYEWRQNCPSLEDCDFPIILVAGGPDTQIAEVQLALGFHYISLWIENDGATLISAPISVLVKPLADAGGDQVIASTNGVDAQVTLDGSNSIGDLDSIIWRLGLTEIATGPTAVLTLPIGTHTIAMEILGPDFTWAEDIITIVVASPPIADAGEDRTVKATSLAGATVTLDGSGSTAAGDAEVIFWRWTVDGALLADGEIVDVVLPPGATMVALTIQDSNLLFGNDAVNITVKIPAAHAGPDVTVVATSPAGTFVTLDGSGSVGDIVSWEWSTDANPELGSGAVAYVLLPLGVNVVTLTVTDEEDATDTDTVIITVVPPTGTPSASVTPDRRPVGGSVEFELEFFPPEATVTIDLITGGDDVTPIGSAVTNAIGETSGNFTIPAAPGGVAQIRFTSGDTVVSADFEIASRIRVVPDSVAAGSQVTVELTGFAPNDTNSIRWRVGNAWVPVGSVQIGADGSATTTVTVPFNAAPGANSVRSDGTNFAAQTNAVTVVAPAVTVDPTRTTVNNNVTYTIVGYPANSDVTITWRRPGGSTVAVGTATTDATGAATGTFKVPATEGGNLNRITFASGTTSITVSFEVAPRIKVIPDTVSPGQQVDVSLRGYAKQETVRIRWRVNGVWIEVATVTTSNTGSANVLVTVPANADIGQNSVRGDGPINRQQTNAVTVEEAILPE